jgi:glycerophosphoryl diester phosphodiesterase
MGSIPKRRIEPIFKMETPLLFAHRGGVREAPESTIMGFQHAIGARADVLELDVQLTKDGQIVVWHGPELDNVRIENCPDKPARRTRRKIYDFAWSELDAKAWVADPEVKDMEIEQVDLSAVPVEDNRRLLLLSDFMDAFPDQPLNIEIKESFSMQLDAPNRSGLRENIKAFSEILDRHGTRNRKIVVVSADHGPIDEFRRCTENRYSTGLSSFEQLFFTGEEKRSFAFETSHVIVTEELVQRVRDSCGSLFVFITAFWPIRALDKQPSLSEAERSKIFRLLDMGVDGIMTDRPAGLRKLMDSWIDGKRVV